MKIYKFEDIKPGYFLTYVGANTKNRIICEIQSVLSYEKYSVYAESIVGELESYEVDDIFNLNTVNDEVYTSWEDIEKLYPEALI